MAHLNTGRVYTVYIQSHPTSSVQLVFNVGSVTSYSTDAIQQL